MNKTTNIFYCLLFILLINVSISYAQSKCEENRVSILYDMKAFTYDTTCYNNISHAEKINNEVKKKKKRSIVLFIKRNENNTTLKFINELVGKYKFIKTHLDNGGAYSQESTSYSLLGYIRLKIKFKIKDKLNEDLEIITMYRRSKNHKGIHY